MPHHYIITYVFSASFVLALVLNELVLVLEKAKTCRVRVPSYGLSTNTKTQEFL